MKFRFSLLLALTATLAACGAPRPVTDVNKVRNSKHAVKLINEVDYGIKTTTTTGAASGAKNTGFNTKFFNMGFSGTEVNVPMTVTVDLGNSPAAQKIRAEKTPVYTYVRPRYELSIRNNKSKREYKKERRFNLPNTSLCDGYYVILHPGNNYKRSWSLNEKVEIREKSTGIDAGIWGNSLGSSDWEARAISDNHTTKSWIQLAPFRKDINRKHTKTCYPDKATRAAWKN